MKNLVSCLAALLAASSVMAARLPSVQIVESASQALIGVPVTLGQVFAKGDVKAGQSITATLKGAQVPLQADIKATHDDGSLRHAVLTAVLPKLAAGETATLQLAAAPATAAAGRIQPDALLASGFHAV